MLWFYTFVVNQIFKGPPKGEGLKPKCGKAVVKHNAGGAPENLYLTKIWIRFLRSIS